MLKFKGTIPAEKVTVGGLAIKLEPSIFQQLVEREALPVIHGLKGTISKNHIYLTVHEGMTYFTKVKDPLLGIQVSVEARDITSFISL